MSACLHAYIVAVNSPSGPSTAAHPKASRNYGLTKAYGPSFKESYMAKKGTSSTFPFVGASALLLFVGIVCRWLETHLLCRSSCRRRSTCSADELEAAVPEVHGRPSRYWVPWIRKRGQALLCLYRETKVLSSKSLARFGAPVWYLYTIHCRGHVGRDERSN